MPQGDQGGDLHQVVVEHPVPHQVLAPSIPSMRVLLHLKSRLRQLIRSGCLSSTARDLGTQVRFRRRAAPRSVCPWSAAPRLVPRARRSPRQGRARHSRDLRSPRRVGSWTEASVVRQSYFAAILTGLVIRRRGSLDARFSPASLGQPQWLLDLGANHGEFTKMISASYAASWVEVEPNRSLHREIILSGCKTSYMGGRGIGEWSSKLLPVLCGQSDGNRSYISTRYID